MLGLNQRGISFLGVLVMMATLMTMALGGFEIISQQNAAINRINSHLTATMIRSNLYNNLSDAQAWQFILDDVASNTSLNCVRVDTESCSSFVDVKQPINTVYNPDGTPYFNSTEAANGFDPNGIDTCETFIPFSPGIYGDPGCPFRPEVSWQPVCEDAACMNPKVRVTVNFNYNSSDTQLMNSSRYNFSFLK